MRRFYIYSILLFIFCLPLTAQTFTSSNLPICIITTDGGVSIPDEPGVLGNLQIIYRGPGKRNYVTDQNNPAYLNYDGRIDIEIRGSSSQFSPKKNYGFTTLKADNYTNNNVSLLGMPAENDWILGGMVFDTALIRDYLSLNLSRKLGNYASRTEYCEVMVNNDYKGLFLLQEKIKADEGRVDVLKIGTGDNTMPNISGGYITKADKTSGGDPIAWTMYSFQGSPVDYIHVLPKPENASFYQTGYIRGEFTKLETAAKSNDISIVNGYPAIIDIPSFIDYMIINEFASNPDAYQYSTFFHKDRNGKLRAGPIWDLDLSFGNDLFFWGMDRSKTNLWYFEDPYYNNGSRFWYDLFYNSTYKCYLAKRWNEVIQPGQPMYPDSIKAFIDKTVTYISEAMARDYERWDKLGSHAQRITNIKNFINARMLWMTQNLGTYETCSNITVPGLVISKINYHPSPTAAYPDDDDLEFIEIQNNSDVTVSLTGIYFRGTGLTYVFPAGTSLGPYLSVIIASNTVAFRANWDITPFGQFTRHLSNSSESLVLLDAFGNVIDEVCYSDLAPWPAADGNGYWLKLTDVNLDNSLASSWTASNGVISSTGETPEDMSIDIYPNPVSDFLYIKSDLEIISLKLYDMQGRVLMEIIGGDNMCEIDVRDLIRGTYIVKVITNGGSRTEKIVKD
ncbi:MAG: CotH kinase family protein [Bacteroidales bacterium]